MKSKPKFVLISDIHFNEKNLSLSSQALSAALTHARLLSIPLVIAGDLNDTKAIIRAEVANRLVDVLSISMVDVFILVGNHDLVNEKGEEHGLNYLRPFSKVIDFACSYDELPGVLFIPYQNSAETFEKIVKQKARAGDLLVIHQGVKGALMGDYVQDKSAIDPAILKDYKVFSGHYHKHQTVGTVTYAGSPFTMSYGEANDGQKGFLVVNEDGSFRQVPLDLRRHIIETVDLSKEDFFEAKRTPINKEDLVWVKLLGTQSQLDNITKDQVAKYYIGHLNFKFDKISTASDTPKEETTPQTDFEILDAIIDGIADTDARKAELKALWRELL